MSERQTIARDLGVIRGAKFFRQGNGVMFVFGLDPNNVIGPRKASEHDKAEYPGEWGLFVQDDPFQGTTFVEGATTPMSGADTILARLHEAELADAQQRDADFDGHDDKTGQFVSPQPPKNKGGRPRKVKPNG